MTKPGRKSHSAVNATYQIESVIENSALLDANISEPNNKSKVGTTALMEKYYGLYNYKGNTYLYKITVEAFFDIGSGELKRRFYNLQDWKITANAPGTAKTPLDTVLTSIAATVPGVCAPSSDVSEVSIAQLRAVVKRFDKNFYENKTDATGQLERQPLLDEIAAEEPAWTGDGFQMPPLLGDDAYEM
jgi:hypothetical protein